MTGYPRPQRVITDDQLARRDTMEHDLGIEHDEGLESTDPMADDADLGDAIKDGTSNTIVSGGGGH